MKMILVRKFSGRRANMRARLSALKLRQAHRRPFAVFQVTAANPPAYIVALAPEETK